MPKYPNMGRRGCQSSPLCSPALIVQVCQTYSFTMADSYECKWRVMRAGNGFVRQENLLPLTISLHSSSQKAAKLTTDSGCCRSEGGHIVSGSHQGGGCPARAYPARGCRAGAEGAGRAAQTQGGAGRTPGELTHRRMTGKPGE